MKQRFNEKLKEASKGVKSKNITNDRYNEIIERLEELDKNPTMKRTDQDRQRLKRYCVKTSTLEGRTIKRLFSPVTGKAYVDIESLYDTINNSHIEAGHVGRDKMVSALDDYANITKDDINIYLSLCEICMKKRNKPSKGLVTHPIKSSKFNARCQVDLIDFQSQPDGEYKFILNYQDHLTKYCIIRPLKTKEAKEVAGVIFSIFCDFGAPHILHSDNGREFVNRVILHLKELFPGLILVRGKPRHSQSQGSVERANQDVEKLIACEQKQHNTSNWRTLLPLIQMKKNSTHHRTICQVIRCFLCIFITTLVTSNQKSHHQIIHN